MRILRSVKALFPAILSGGILFISGCGGGNQTDGELVTPTEEVEESRAAMQNQLQQNPDMYGPSQGEGQ